MKFSHKSRKRQTFLFTSTAGTTTRPSCLSTIMLTLETGRWIQCRENSPAVSPLITYLRLLWRGKLLPVLQKVTHMPQHGRATSTEKLPWYKFPPPCGNRDVQATL